MNNRERSKLWGENNKQRAQFTARANNLKRFNISIEDFEAMSDLQNNVCASCRCPETVWDRRKNQVRYLTVDHCHKTHKIRGLLCMRCNTALGLLKDDIIKIKRLLFYIYNHETNMDIDPDLE